VDLWAGRFVQIRRVYRADAIAASTLPPALGFEPDARSGAYPPLAEYSPLISARQPARRGTRIRSSN